MSGSYDETIGKDEKDDAGNTFLPTKWTKMGATFGTVQCTSSRAGTPPILQHCRCQVLLQVGGHGTNMVAQ